MHGYGPTFGGGHDIYVANNANAGTASNTNFGYTYKPPTGYSYNTPKTKALFSQAFTTILQPMSLTVSSFVDPRIYIETA